MEQDETGRDIEDVMAVEKRRGRSNRPHDPGRERKIRQLATFGLKAIQARDQRAFTEELKRAGIRENSPEWVRAWKIFYGSS